MREREQGEWGGIAEEAEIERERENGSARERARERKEKIMERERALSFLPSASSAHSASCAHGWRFTGRVSMHAY
eukprot:53780-Pleurochrysis_carterae.AAC.1